MASDFEIQASETFYPSDRRIKASFIYCSSGCGQNSKNSMVHIALLLTIRKIFKFSDQSLQSMKNGNVWQLPGKELSTKSDFCTICIEFTVS